MTRLVSNSASAVLAAALLAGCSQSGDLAKPEVVSAATEVVHVATVPELRVTTGTVRSATVAPLSAKLLGNVTRVLVSEGDRVRAGQILLTIDARDVQAKVAQAQAAAGALDEAIASASAAIDAAQANANFAEATYARFAALRERGSVSPHEFEEVAAKRKGAQAELQRAQRGREQLLAQRAQARGGVAEAEAFLSYAVVRSPIDGTISARFVDPGAQAAPGMPLLAVEGGGDARVDTSVDESLAPRIHIGDPVDVDGIAARVAHVAPVDAMTRSAVIKVALPPGSPLRPGSFVHVGFATGARQTVLLPKAAIARSGDLASVFVVGDDGTARMRLVTIGNDAAARVEILSGLEAGERIVSSAASVRDGVHVRSAS